MIGLQEMLDGRTHRDLELIAHAHNLPFTRREAKATGLAKLSAALHEGAYGQAFATLTSDHIAALRALVVAGGWLREQQGAHEQQQEQKTRTHMVFLLGLDQSEAQQGTTAHCSLRIFVAGVARGGYA